MHYEWMQSACVVREVRGDAQPSLITSVHSASLALVHKMVTTKQQQKSYSAPMCASVNTKQRACSYDLRGELSLLLIIHETSYVAIWRQHRQQWSFTAKESNMRYKLARAGIKNEQQSQENHLRGGFEEETRASSRLAANDLHLSVCCSYKKK